MTATVNGQTPVHITEPTPKWIMDSVHELASQHGFVKTNSVKSVFNPDEQERFHTWIKTGWGCGEVSVRTSLGERYRAAPNRFNFEEVTYLLLELLTARLQR